MTVASLLVASFGAGLPACSINADNPAGYGYVGRGPSVVSSDTFAVSGGDTTWVLDHPLDDSELLFVGAYQDFHSIALLRFTGLPEGATVTSARLTLTRRSKSSAQDSLGSLAVSVAPVTSDWDTSWTGEDFPSLTLGADVGFTEIPYAATEDTFGFTLPESLVQSWVDDPALTQRGIALSAPTSAPYVIYLDSSHSPSIRAINRPRLRVGYTPAGGGATRLASLNPDVDTSLMTFSDTPPAGELWVARGVPWRSMLTFPDSNIPPGATVNRAELHLPVVPTGGIGMPLTLLAAAPAVPAPWTLEPASQLSSGTGSPPIFVAGGDSTATFVVTRALADQVAIGGTIRLVVLSSSESAGIALLRLLDATAPIERRARLMVVYSLPPTGSP